LILAAGLTPAWQQILRFDDFRVGEVNRASDVHWCASGKVLNVGIALAHLGAPSETIAPLGGPALAEIDREFTSLGIRRRWIETHWSTRVCTTILETQTLRATELVENAAPVTAAELEEFATAFAESAAEARLAILTGSLPSGVARVFFRDLALSAGCPVILDMRGQELLEALPCRPFLVKPNREELVQTLGRDIAGDAQLRDAMQGLNDRGAEWVVITQGAGPVWASSRGRFYRFMPPQVEVVNPIGSGDCLAAGIAWGLFGGSQPLDAIRLGIAAAAENVGQLLPGRLDPQRVSRRAESIVKEPL
jgi:tagatose 6-phosphate kinase